MSSPARRERLAALLETRYVDAQVGGDLAARIRAGESDDALAADDDQAIAEALTALLRGWTGDGHLGVVHDVETAHVEVAGAAAPADAEAFDREVEERYYGTHVNHGFEAVRRLEHGIGLLDLRVLAPVHLGGDLAVAAMTLLAECPALVVDLRQNGGGHGSMVALLASYLLDGQNALSAVHDRPSGQVEPLTTSSWVPGRRFGSAKPVYVLTSRRTFSAAEHLAYDLQALGRATVVGGRTGGGAHPFEYRRVDAGLVLALPERRSVNPVTGTNWEGVGVLPDVEVDPDDALDVAVRLAAEAIGASR